MKDWLKFSRQENGSSPHLLNKYDSFSDLFVTCNGKFILIYNGKRSGSV